MHSIYPTQGLRGGFTTHGRRGGFTTHWRRGGFTIQGLLCLPHKAPVITTQGSCVYHTRAPVFTTQGLRGGFTAQRLSGEEVWKRVPFWTHILKNALDIAFA